MLNRLNVFAAALASAALSLAPDANAANGRIVFNHDEWTLSGAGYLDPNDPATFILNSIAWMAGPGPKNLLIYSSNFGLTSPQLLASLNGAGHTVTQSANAAELANID